jgi:hypothetical protein
MGEAVKVGVIVEVEVAVGVTVGDGVVVIDAVGMGLANAPDPHADNKIEIPKTKTIDFFIRFLSD